MPRSTTARPSARPRDDLPGRIAALDWAGLVADLDARGCAVIPALLTPKPCDDLVAVYPDDAAFRKCVVMARHGYGRGEYKYFAYPLPPAVAALRSALYPRLAEVANRWNEAMGLDVRSSTAATPRARPGRPPCCCNTA
ncbi:MAG TPA: 2OG-Fe(II) oxygenase, partial [Urbifossiella sp.]|nr:2OG-Fe(II) oxygenase [Urbifossiella sp.]